MGEVMQQKKEMKVLLAESFKELVLELPIEKITIKEITDRAGVIRVTFYNHFQDKYELLEWIIYNEILNPIQILLRNNMIKEACVLIFTNILHDKEFYRKASHLEGQNSFEHTVQTCIYNILIEFINERTGDKKSKHIWLTPEHLAEYYAQSMCFVVVNWIKTGMTVTPEEMAEIYIYIGMRSMNDILDEMQ